MNGQHSKESDQMTRTEGQIMSSCKERMIFAVQLFHSEQEIAISQRNSSIFNDESIATEGDFKGSRRESKEIRQQQDSCTTRDQDFVAPATCHIPL
jgi:hypothetical protein